MTLDAPPAALRHRIAQDLRPVRPLLPPAARTALAVPLLAALLVPAPWLLGIRHDVVELGAAWVFGIALLQASLGVALLGLALARAVPRLGRRRWVPAAVIALAAAWLAATVWLGWLRHPTELPVGLELRYWRICFSYSFLFGLPVLALATWLLSRARSFEPVLAGALVGAAAGLSAEAGERIACEVSLPGHLLFSHLLAVAALAGLGALCGLAINARQRAVPLVLAAALGGWPALAAAKAQGADRPHELAAAERSFAALAAAQGRRKAFLTYLAPGAVIVDPTPLDGRALYEALPANAPGLLAWEPSAAFAAAAGDLGYTTGPWTWHDNDDRPPTAFGEFLSLWQRDGEGTWRVIADAGIHHGPPAAGDSIAPASSYRSSAETAEHPGAIEDAEGEYCGQLDQPGTAFSRWADPAVLLLRIAQLPQRGRDAALTALADLPAETGCETAGARSSASTDLAGTWGIGTTADGGRYGYLRIWRRERGTGWRLVADLAKPVPPE